MGKLKICVVGGGSWGLNHIKTLLSMNKVVGCVDIEHNQLMKIKSLFPAIACYSNIDESLKDNFDGYIISTPPSTHFELSKFIISNNKPLLVEKPLSLSVKEAEAIKFCLKKYDGRLVVGHIMLFHPAIKKIKALINSGKIGKIQYLYSNRLNLGKVRKEENVFWSFAPHDISIFQYLTDSFPIKVYSTGGVFLQKGIYDSTITYLNYPNSIQGHIFVSWLNPFKEHRLVVIGEKGAIHFEDSSEGKPLFFYENDNDSGKYPIQLKNKKPRTINYKMAMPLENELKYFIEVIRGKSIKIANIDEGIDVIKILETASKSLKIND
tara:strand:- start:423 stop:1391 length:969 start_codon:yes stop_codon:yes gene_type:complete